MCGAPKVEEPTQLQASKEPVFNTSSTTQRSNRGRRGTILSQAAAPSPVVAPASAAGGKTLLGQ